MYIYIATNTADSRQYVGQSIINPAKKRINEHRFAGSGTFFHRVIRKYGFDNFTWEIICYPNATKESLDAIECWYIAKLNTLAPNGYNLQTGGNSGRHTPETLKKMSESQKGEKNHRFGKSHTPEHCQKMSKILKGRPSPMKGKKHSAESIAKMSESTKGQKHSPETRDKIHKANTGRVFSETHRKRLSEANKGKKDSPETRRRKSQAQKSRTLSAEHRAKIGEANRRRTQSPETRKKISETKKRNHAKRIGQTLISFKNDTYGANL